MLQSNFYSYLEQRIRARLDFEFNQVEITEDEFDFEVADSELTQFISNSQLSADEILILILTLVPHVSTIFLSDIISEFLPNGGDFPAFGGVKGKNHRGIIPTGETALYILAGSDIDNRIILINYILNESSLFKNGVVELEPVPNGEPIMSGKLIIPEEYIHLFLTEKEFKPQMSSNFPANLIKTDLEWSDLILNDKTKHEVQEIQTWIEYNQVLLQDWGMDQKIKPGYRVLLFGPPGTGKTLTASLLGKYTERDVYRIDLSMVVSKYIGETEKNLSKLFDKATNKNWILFFDEADAIFGKRTNVRDAHDKYANQEVSYLLQRIESHPGLVILASNFKNNIDVAFTRRFQSIIEFVLPEYNERLKLWENNLPSQIDRESGLTIEDIAQKYALTGANIVNIVQYACLKTIAYAEENKLSKPLILKKFILEGIRKEYLKEGKTITVI